MNEKKNLFFEEYEMIEHLLMLKQYDEIDYLRDGSSDSMIEEDKYENIP